FLHGDLVSHSIHRHREAPPEHRSSSERHGIPLRKDKDDRSMSRIAVMGSGAWGTAIAISLSRRGGHEIHLWSFEKDVAEVMRNQRENTVFLPGFRLDDSIAVTPDPAEALRGAEIVVSVTPSEFTRSSFKAFAPHLNEQQILVSATKGIEDGSYLRMTQVIAEVLSARGLNLACGVLSGPSFAQEVAAGAPTAITIASADAEVASRVQREFSSRTLRLYTNDDVVGAELGGSIKNVIAIAAGIVAGLGLGFNSNAALITRGIAEMTRLAMACGGRRETLAGLAGAIWCSPAPGRFRAIARWAWNSAAAAACRRSSKVSEATLQKASVPPP